MTSLRSLSTKGQRAQAAFVVATLGRVFSCVVLAVVVNGLGGCRTPSPLPQRGETTSSRPAPPSWQCFFGDSVCAFDGVTSTQVIGHAAGRAFWLTTVPLVGLSANAGETLLQRKTDEDVSIYSADGHPFAEEVAACCVGDVQTFLAMHADTMGYSGSLWQKMSAVGAWARSGKTIAPQTWIAADPLIGTAGNGPAIILPALPFVGGDIEGSVTTKIAIAHDVDWSLGRYLGAGPLAPFLFPARFGGAAPDRYSSSLGLAGLGEVVCDPNSNAGTTEDEHCAWYTFSDVAFGGSYAQLTVNHPDWSVDAIDLTTTPTASEVCHGGDCVCFRVTDATTSATFGECEHESR